jgi:hypothetical protein
MFMPPLPPDNAAIYLGRGLSYGVVILAGQAAAAQLAGGDAAAAEAPWRTLLWWLGPPGLLIAGLAWWTVREPRQQQQAASGNAAAPQAAQAPAAAAPARPTMAQNLGRLGEVASSPSFMALTGAAAVNDVASWGLIGWQSSFYARVFELEPAVYAPLVAVGISAGGLVGGIGSGGQRGGAAGAEGLSAPRWGGAPREDRKRSRHPRCMHAASATFHLASGGRLSPRINS